MGLIRILTTTTPGAATAATRAAEILNIPVAHGTALANVGGSHATLLFASTRVKGDEDCRVVRQACADLKRPLLVIPAWAPVVPSPVKVAEMIRAAGFQVVNCAGTRGSADPAVAGVIGSGIEEWVFTFCVCVFEILKGDH